MNINKLLPENKSDISNTEYLMNISDEEIYPIIPDLLEWLKDFNWPVAPYIAEVILKHQKISEPFIGEILSPEQTDDIWKYWIIKELLPKWNGTPSKKILDEIRRIGESPTDGELTEEVNITAKEYLNIAVRRNL